MLNRFRFKQKCFPGCQNSRKTGSTRASRPTAARALPWASPALVSLGDTATSQRARPPRRWLVHRTSAVDQKNRRAHDRRLWVTKTPFDSEIVDGGLNRCWLNRYGFTRSYGASKPGRSISLPSSPRHGESGIAAPTAGAEPHGQGPHPAQFRPAFLGSLQRDVVAVDEGAKMLVIVQPQTVVR